jgi:hypothetical protein
VPYYTEYIDYSIAIISSEAVTMVMGQYTFPEISFVHNYEVLKMSY